MKRLIMLAAWAWSPRACSASPQPTRSGRSTSSRARSTCSATSTASPAPGKQLGRRRALRRERCEHDTLRLRPGVADRRGHKRQLRRSRTSAGPRPGWAAPASTDFDASFDIGTTTDAFQPGLAISVSLEQRRGWADERLRFVDQADGVHVLFDDVTDPGPGTTPWLRSTRPTSGRAAGRARTRSGSRSTSNRAPQAGRNTSDDVKIFIDGQKDDQRHYLGG